MKTIGSLVIGLTLSLLLHAADHKKELIDQKNRAFSRPMIAISAGDVVLFHNADEVVHNVSSLTPGQEFEVKRLAPGASWPVHFDKPGKVEVRCELHPTEKLIVFVQQ